MNDQEYQRQIGKAKKLIEDKIRNFANSRGIKISEMKWHKEKIPSTNYILMIKTESKKGEYAFSAERLADFPAESKENSITAQAVTRYIEVMIKELQETS